jgi:hypothetical protein
LPIIGSKLYSTNRNHMTNISSKNKFSIMDMTDLYNGLMGDISQPVNIEEAFDYSKQNIETLCKEYIANQDIDAIKDYLLLADNNSFF